MGGLPQGLISRHFSWRVTADGERLTVADS